MMKLEAIDCLERDHGGTLTPIGELMKLKKMAKKIELMIFGKLGENFNFFNVKN